jgi:hypothetical protein
MGIHRKEGRRSGRLVALVAAVASAAAIYTGTTPAAARSQTAQAADSNGLDALVLGGAASPGLAALRDVANLDTTPRAETGAVDPQRYDMLVVDGDQLTPDALRTRPALEDFVAAGRWIAAFDLGPRDLDALATYTGFDVADREHSDRSEMFVFRVGKVEGTPTVEMVNSGPYAQPGTARLGDRRRKEVRQDHLLRVARIVDREVTPEGGKGKLAAIEPKSVPCTPLDPAPSSELQHVGYCYTVTGVQPPPSGHWGEKSDPWWADWWKSDHAPGKQTTSWVMNHRFDVFLNSDPTHTNGLFQTVSYELNGNFSPKQPNENFFRMNRPNDYMYTGWGAPTGTEPWIVERAWWTGQIGDQVVPSTETDKRLTLLKNHPETPNAETSYSSGEDFSIGFNGTAGNLQNVAGGGVSLNYGINNSKSYSIPDWGVQNLGASNSLFWLFSARQPCNTTTAANSPGDCFETYAPTHQSPCPRSPFISPCFPADPKPLSKGQAAIHTFGSWRTADLLGGSDGQLTFNVATPIRIVDTYCDAVWHSWCDPLGAAPARYRSENVGPGPQDFKIDASVVNPVPIKELKLSPNPANGAKSEDVTGTVVLEKPARIPVTVKLYSDSDNAKLGAPLPGVTHGSQNELTIDPGKASATFTVRTNDNQLSPGGHTTATISAFYSQATSQPLRIERP